MNETKKPKLKDLSKPARGIATSTIKASMGSDSDCVIVTSAHLDNAFYWCFKDRLHFRDDKHASEFLSVPGAPLNSFAARIKLARVLNIINDELEAGCNGIRKIRNTFAHSDRPPNFESEAIKAECMLLPILGQPKHNIVRDENMSTRSRFTTFCNDVGSILRDNESN